MQQCGREDGVDAGKESRKKRKRLLVSVEEEQGRCAASPDFSKVARKLMFESVGRHGGEEMVARENGKLSVVAEDTARLDDKVSGKKRRREEERSGGGGEGGFAEEEKRRRKKKGRREVVEAEQLLENRRDSSVGEKEQETREGVEVVAEVTQSLGKEKAAGKKKRDGMKMEAPSPDAGPSSGSSKPGILKLGKGEGRKKVTFEEPPQASEDTPAASPPEAGGGEDFLFGRDKSWVKDDRRKDLINGKFKKEEDELLKQSVMDYIRKRGWNEEEGLNAILDVAKSTKRTHCWHEIGSCLPKRSLKSLYARAHRLLNKGSHLGKWSKEEEEALIRLHAEHGSNWTKISKALGRFAYAAKDKWRDLKMQGNLLKGALQQSELETVASLVHKCIREKALMVKDVDKVDRRLIRDDINWEDISDALGTRTHSLCCKTWYVTLASSMVSQGLWANTDDFMLLKRLLESGADSEDAVDWDHLLEGREGYICRRRWDQMGKHLGPYRQHSFGEKLHRLVKRYAPELITEGEA